MKRFVIVAKRSVIVLGALVIGGWVFIWARTRVLPVVDGGQAPPDDIDWLREFGQ